MILPLSPGLRSTLCALAACFYTCLPLVSRLSPTLGALGRMLLHLSATCLPLVFRDARPGPRDFIHLSPTLGALGGVILHLSPTCLPHLSSILGALGFYICLPFWVLWDFTFVSRLSPTCLPLRALWAAWFYMCLPLVSHTWLPFWMLWAAWFYTCLPLWVVWAAWFYICLPLDFTLDAKYVAIRFVPATVVSLQHWTLLHLFGVNAGIICF